MHLAPEASVSHPKSFYLVYFLLVCERHLTVAEDGIPFPSHRTLSGTSEILGVPLVLPRELSVWTLFGRCLVLRYTFPHTRSRKKILQQHYTDNSLPAPPPKNNPISILCRQISWDFQLRLWCLASVWLCSSKLPYSALDSRGDSFRYFLTISQQLGPLLDNSSRSPTSRGHRCRVAVCCKSSPKAQWTDSNFVLLKLVSLWSQRDSSMLWGVRTFVFYWSFIFCLPFSFFTNFVSITSGKKKKNLEDLSLLGLLGLKVKMNENSEIILLMCL